MKRLEKAIELSFIFHKLRKSIQYRLIPYREHWGYVIYLIVNLSYYAIHYAINLMVNGYWSDFNNRELAGAILTMIASKIILIKKSSRR